MAINTLDGAISGMTPPVDVLKIGAVMVIGRYYSPFYVPGRPGAAVAPTPGIGGAALTAYTGSVPWTNPASGNSYLARLVASCSTAGTLLLCDRLWHNSGINVTLATLQTINSAAWPARDRIGSTNGAQVFIGAEVSTIMGAGVPTWTMAYTNSAGTGSRTFTTIAQTAAMAVGSFIPIGLQAGDVGVRSIQSWTQSATMTSGVYHLVAYRVLAVLPVLLPNIANYIDVLTGGFTNLYDNTVPFLLWLPTVTTASNIAATLTVAQG